MEGRKAGRKYSTLNQPFPNRFVFSSRQVLIKASVPPSILTEKFWKLLLNLSSSFANWNKTHLCIHREFWPYPSNPWAWADC